jgi:NADH-quinone oxidoreductase E subunit
MRNVSEVLENYSDKKELMSALQAIQKEYGYLSEENLILLSKKIDVPLAQISGVATFYNWFKLKPVGKYHVAICRGTACHVNNSEQLLHFLEKRLKINAGELTEDKMFSLECVNCIGACAKAPAMMINDTVYGELTEKKIDQIIEELRNKK